MKEVRYTGVMMERKLTGSLLGDVTQDKHGGCVVHHWTVCCVYLFVFGMEHYRTGTTELWVAPHPEERACLLVALVWLTGAKSGPSRAALSESVSLFDQFMRTNALHFEGKHCPFILPHGAQLESVCRQFGIFHANHGQSNHMEVFIAGTTVWLILPSNLQHPLISWEMHIFLYIWGQERGTAKSLLQCDWDLTCQSPTCSL